MRWLAVVLGVMLAGWAAPAAASGDVGCTPKWKLGVTEMSGCDSRLALSPANDTRVNLFLLMRDRRGASVQPPRMPAEPLLPHFEWVALRNAWLPPPPADPVYIEGEGSRCRSNIEAREGFVAAVRAARGLAEAERTALIVARNNYDPDCDAGKPMLVPVTATTAKPFADYLRAAAAFYSGDFDGAGRVFAGLTGADDPWLAETALYMTARIELNRAQESAFDDWGELDRKKVDRGALSRAQANFDRYLAAFPRGRYAASARGLLRRVWWFAGDKARLAAAYGDLMRQDPATRGIDDFALAQEIDYKLGAPTPDIADPLLLAVLDLVAMRKPAGEEGALTAAELERQRPAFAREPVLYGYLQAAFALHVAGRPADVLRLIPDATTQRNMGVLTLSRQLLRGQALDAVRDPNARGFWLQLLPAAGAPMQRALVELGLAMHDERAGRLDALLAPGSALTTPVLRETLLFTVADAAMLRRAARSPVPPRHERDVALFQLLYKQLSRGGYAGFVADLALVPAGASTDPIDRYGSIATTQPPLGLFKQTRRLGDLGCPPLKATATTLAANPANPRARLCVADFFQANDFDGGTFDAQPAADELGGTSSLFPGRPYERAAVYRALLADPATPADDKAYALYRAMRCYAPTGSNSCGGADVPQAQRAAWFRQLKRDHPRSRWARRLSFYW